MKKLLCIVGRMHHGGAETFLMKIQRNLDKSEYQMDFCVSSDGSYDEEIRANGGRIFSIGRRSKNWAKVWYKIYHLVKQERYESVYCSSAYGFSVLDLIPAKLAGAQVVALRSSSSTANKSYLKVLQILFRPLVSLVVDVKIAPSDVAAEWMFGKKSIKNNSILYLNNALDTEIFDFNEEKRQTKREELKLSNKFIVGHVGRFSEVKNHKFLLDVFYEIKKLSPNSSLVLVGDGTLQQQIKDRAARLGILEDVQFLGSRTDIPDLLQAMDVLVFPSIYEGMPNAVIEAQATGLMCFASDTITKQANIAGLVNYLPLSNSSTQWAEHVLRYSNYERKSMKENYIEKGYDIKSVSEKLLSELFYSADKDE